jgi:hypothetical protein
VCGWMEEGWDRGVYVRSSNGNRYFPILSMFEHSSRNVTMNVNILRGAVFIGGLVLHS